MLKIFTFCLFFCQLTASLAQNFVISGRVTDKKNEPAFGVNILLLGSGKGASTDFDGKFKLSIPEAQAEAGQLRVSGVGYTTQVITIKGRSVINIVVEEEAKTLKEAVVVGIAKPERKIYSPTNSSTIQFAEMKTAPTPSFTESLQGRAPGLQVTQSSGVPGAATNIRIRGTSSLSASSDPLVVVDGIPVISGGGGDGGGGIGGGLNLGYQSNALANINPNDIENIEVLKDAAACAKYGARGSNGVLLVTTKKGSKGTTTFVVNYQKGFQDLTNRVELLDGKQFLNVMDSAYFNTWRQNPANLTLKPTDSNYPNRARYYSFPTPAGFNDSLAGLTNTNWLDQLLRIGILDELSISAQGGTTKTNYFISGNYLKNQGVMVGNDFDRFGGRFNLNNIVSDKLQIGIKTYVGFTNSNQVPSGGNADALGGFGTAQLRSLPIFPIYKNQGDQRAFDQFGFNPFFNAYGDYAGTNIALTQNQNYASYTEQKLTSTTNLFADYKLGRNLSYRLEYGIDIFSQINKFYQSRYLRTSEIVRNTPMAAVGDARVFFNNQNINNIINYTKNLDEKQELDFSFVQNYQSTTSYNNGARGENLPNDETRSLSQASIVLSPRSGNETQFKFLSFLGIANYKLKDRYIAQVSLRYDGSSRLGEDQRFGYFPAVGLGYIVSEESFIKNIDQISFLKVKGSVGQTGNAAGINNFQSLGLYSGGGNYAFNPTIVPRQIQNRNLTWEKGLQFDASVEFGLFKERFSGSVGYFNKLTYDLLLNLPMPPSSGIQTNYFVNQGRMRNQGIELELNTTNIETKPFTWKTNFNMTFIQNKLLSLGNLSSNSIGSLDYVSLTGNQLSTFYLPKWAGVNPETGEEEIYEVIKEDYSNPNSPYQFTGRKLRPIRVGQIDSNRIAMADKPVLPKFFGGFTSRFIFFKNLEVSFFFTFSVGNYLLDQGQRRQSYVTGSNNLRSDAIEAWTRPGQQTDYPKLFYPNAPGVFGPGQEVPDNFWYTNDPMRFRNTSRFLHDGSYFRLRQINISYSLSESMCKAIRMKSVRVFATAQNLLVFTKFPGWDPEVVGNLATNAERNLQIGTTDLDFPQLKSFVMGLNISF